MINAPNLLSKIWLDQIIIPIAKKHQQIAKKLRIDEFSGTILTGLGVLLRNEMLRTRMASIPQKIYSPHRLRATYAESLTERSADNTQLSISASIQ